MISLLLDIRLTIALMALLILEASAKIVFIVKGFLAAKGLLLLLPELKHDLVYRNPAVVVVRVAENYTLSTNVVPMPAFIYIADW